MPPIMFFSNFPISYARWASTPIMYQQCNCNNGNNQWLNWWMMSEMVKNIGQMFRKPEKQPPIPYAYNPYQQYVNPYQTMYPYVNLNNTQQYPLTEQDEGLRELQEAYKNCKTKFSFVKVNDKYIAIDKDGKRIKADTVEELMDLIDAKVDGQGGLKPEETDPTQEVVPTEEVPPAEEKSPINPAETGNRTGKVHIPNGWIGAGTKQQITDENFTKKIKANMTSTGVVTEIVNYYSDKYKFDLSKVDKTKLSDKLVKVNPSIFVDGKIKEGFDINKLTMPGYEYFKSVSVTKPKVNNPTKGVLKNGITVYGTEYSEGYEWKSGNKLYKNQTGSWSKWDRDAIFLINNKKFTINNGGDAIDYGELIGTSNFIGKIKPIFDNQKGQFKGDYSESYSVYQEGKGRVGSLYVKNGKTVIKVNDIEYDMNEVMAGNVNVPL